MTPQNVIAADLKNLLTKWKLECLLHHFLAEKIDIDVLQMMKLSHIRLVLDNFPLGILIRFEYNLEKWRKDMGRPFQTPESEERYSTLTPTRNFKNEKLKNNKQNREVQTDLMMCNLNSTPQINRKVVKSTGSMTAGEDPLSLAPQPTRPVISNPFKTPRTASHVDLRTILLHSESGLNLIKNYRFRRRFSNSERRLLISTIVNYYLEYNIEFNDQISYALERDILKMFRSEMLSFYRTTTCGRIYTSYVKAKAALRQETANYANKSNNSMNNNELAVDAGNNEIEEFPIESQLINNDYKSNSLMKSDIMHSEKEYNDSIVSDSSTSMMDYIKIEPEELSDTSSLDSMAHKIYTNQQLQTQDFERPFHKFQIPWFKLPNEVTSLLENKEQLGKGLNVIANIIIDELRCISTHIPVRVLRTIAQQAVAKYPDSFLDKDGQGNMMPLSMKSVPLLSRMRNRNCNLNREKNLGGQKFYSN